MLAGRDVNWNAGDGSGTVDGINDPLRAATDGSHSAIRRSDYRLIHITADRVTASGDVEDIHVQTLQPLAWVEEHDVRRGGMAPLPIDMVELGLPEGMTGLVTAVLPCPTLQHGAGRLVITTVNSLSAETVELTIITPDGDLETLRPTAGHKFYSVTRGEWLDAWDLQDGEHLNGRHGTLTVADIRLLPGTRRVYNMTVQGHHFYRVGDSGILVHNSHCGPKDTSSHSKKAAADLEANGYPRPSLDHQAAHLVPTNNFGGRSAAVQKAITSAHSKFDKYLGEEQRDKVINTFWAEAGHAGTHTDKFFVELGKEFRKVQSEAQARAAIQKMWKRVERGDFVQ